MLLDFVVWAPSNTDTQLHCAVGAIHSLPTVVGMGVLWVLTGTHQCDATSRQDDVTPERQLLLACELDHVSVAGSWVCCHLVSTSALVLSCSTVRVCNAELIRHLRGYANSPSSTWSSLRAGRPKCNLSLNFDRVFVVIDLDLDLIKAPDAIRLLAVVSTLSS